MYYGRYLCILHKYSYLIKTLSTQKVPHKTTEKSRRWYVATEVTIFWLINLNFFPLFSDEEVPYHMHNDCNTYLVDSKTIHNTVVYVSSYTPNGVGSTSGTSVTSGEFCVARGLEERNPVIKFFHGQE